MEARRTRAARNVLANIKKRNTKHTFSSEEEARQALSDANEALNVYTRWSKRPTPSQERELSEKEVRLIGAFE